jgi:hypothetical protein
MLPFTKDTLDLPEYSTTFSFPLPTLIQFWLVYFTETTDKRFFNAKYDTKTK